MFYQPLGADSHLSGCSKLRGFIFWRYVIVEQKKTRKTAILVDGGYYRKRAKALWGEKGAKDRADELIAYCMLHITEPNDPRDLYRIFYYDCPGMTRQIEHPLTGEIIDFSVGSGTQWTKDFFSALSKKRNVAIRRGELAESQAFYALKPEVLTALLAKEKSVDDLEKSDFRLDVKQKGVDMRIGLDASSIAQTKCADQIILIAGDSDFVPAAKYARRNGIEFILDPMKQYIKQNLMEHIDAVETVVNSMV